MFTAIKDTNTGVVYDWYMKNEDGTEVHVSVPRESWKKEQDWSTEEIAALFVNSDKKPEIESIYNTIVIDVAPDVLEDATDLN